MRIIYTKENFKIGQTTRDYVVIRTDGEYEHHAHFKKENAARDCVRLMVKHKKPRGRYMREACRRLGMDVERKDKYVNCHV